MHPFRREIKKKKKNTKYKIKKKTKGEDKVYIILWRLTVIIHVPRYYSIVEDYKKLCAQQPLQFTVINECAFRPEICGNGKCVDTKEGYECECYPGFTKKNGRCEDIDECQLGYCQGGTCRNYEGSFVCQCPPGFTVSGEGKYCTG